MAKDQIQQVRMNKYYLLILVSLCSCGSSQKLDTKTDDNYYIINQEIKKLISIDKKVYLINKFNNDLSEILDDLIFEEKNYEFHFLTTRYSLPKEKFKYLFNEPQIEKFKNQVLDNYYIEFSKIENKSISVFNLEKIKKNEDPSINFGKFMIGLSYPVFTKNKEYALITYYTGSYNTGNGIRGVSIYKKENNRWQLYKRIMLGIE